MVRADGSAARYHPRMTNPSPSPAPAAPPWRGRVDRVSAATGGAWRLLAASLPLGALYGWGTFDWALMQTTQPLTFAALIVVALMLGVIGLWLAFAGLRRILLAAWPRSLSFQIDSAGIAWTFGPFGRGAVPWELIDAGTAENYDADMLALLPNDAFRPIVRHRRDGTDLHAWLQSITGIPSEDINHALRPYLTSHDLHEQDD